MAFLSEGECKEGCPTAGGPEADRLRSKTETSKPPLCRGKDSEVEELTRTMRDVKLGECLAAARVKCDSDEMSPAAIKGDIETMDDTTLLDASAGVGLSETHIAAEIRTQKKDEMADTLKTDGSRSANGLRDSESTAKAKALATSSLASKPLAEKPFEKHYFVVKRIGLETDEKYRMTQEKYDYNGTADFHLLTQQKIDEYVESAEWLPPTVEMSPAEVNLWHGYHHSDALTSVTLPVADTKFDFVTFNKNLNDICATVYCPNYPKPWVISVNSQLTEDGKRQIRLEMNCKPPLEPETTATADDIIGRTFEAAMGNRAFESHVKTELAAVSELKVGLFDVCLLGEVDCVDGNGEHVEVKTMYKNKWGKVSLNQFAKIFSQAVISGMNEPLLVGYKSQTRSGTKVTHIERKPGGELPTVAEFLAAHSSDDWLEKARVCQEFLCDALLWISNCVSDPSSDGCLQLVFEAPFTELKLKLPKPSVELVSTMPTLQLSATSRRHYGGRIGDGRRGRGHRRDHAADHRRFGRDSPAKARDWHATDRATAGRRDAGGRSGGGRWDFCRRTE